MPGHRLVMLVTCSPTRVCKPGQLRLQRSGAITGYTADIDRQRLRSTIHVVARLRSTQAQVAPTLELFAGLPEVMRIYRLTGEDCFLVDLHAVDAGGWRR